MRLGLMETTDNGKRAATLLGAGSICTAAYLIDILCAGLSDPGSAALTANVALPLDLMAVAPLAFLIAYVRPCWKSLSENVPRKCWPSEHQRWYKLLNRKVG